MVLFRAANVAGFCLLIGWIVWRRTASFWLAIGAVFAASTLARGIAVDRPYVMTYLLLALTVLILERRRPLWALPRSSSFGPICTAASSWDGSCSARTARKRWSIVCAANHPPMSERCGPRASPRSRVGAQSRDLRRHPGMLAYRQSFMQNTLREWHSPAFWPLAWYSGLLLAAALVMLAAWRRVRVADWLLFGIFAALSFMAERNVIFIALIAPIAIASYLPKVSAFSSDLRVSASSTCSRSSSC